MKDRIIERIKSMTEHRDRVMENYLVSLDQYDPNEGSISAVERAGILHDLDKHLTNLQMELKRINAIERMGSKPEMEVIRG
jgi:HD superfamily phosphohydrolase YqeK